MRNLRDPQLELALGQDRPRPKSPTAPSDRMGAAASPRRHVDCPTPRRPRYCNNEPNRAASDDPFRNSPLQPCEPPLKHQRFGQKPPRNSTILHTTCELAQFLSAYIVALNLNRSTHKFSPTSDKCSQRFRSATDWQPKKGPIYTSAGIRHWRRRQVEMHLAM